MLFNYNHLLMGKHHGQLAKAGKVRKQTPKVAKLPAPRKPRGKK